MSFFSVIIPLYNKENFIEATLNTVLNQSFNDFEIIIINDGSTDKSLDLVKQIKDKRIKIITIPNSGLSVARNTGLDNANADYIAFIDADDFWEPHHLEQLNKLILLFPNNGMYCSGYTLKKSKNISKRAIFNDLPENFKGIVPDFFKHSLLNCIAWISAICIPKHVFNDIGIFDPELFSEQDTDLYIRIALNYNVALDNTCVSAIYNKTMENGMSNASHKKTIPKLLYVYKNDEKNNPTLKKYIDYNRFSFIIHAKLNSNITSTKNLINEIDTSNLTNYQLLLTKLPNQVVRLLFFIKTKSNFNTRFIFKPKVN
jgi:glycosyltransferase involved in cell wall biosynthesis